MTVCQLKYPVHTFITLSCHTCLRASSKIFTRMLDQSELSSEARSSVSTPLQSCGLWLEVVAKERISKVNLTCQMIRAVFKTSTFCSVSLADPPPPPPPPGAEERFPKSLFKWIVSVKTSPHIRKSHCVMLIWGIWEFLVAAVITLISLMNTTLAWDHSALSLYESTWIEFPGVKNKKKSGANQLDSDEKVRFLRPYAFVTFNCGSKRVADC